MTVKELIHLLQTSTKPDWEVNDELIEAMYVVHVLGNATQIIKLPKSKKRDG